VGTYSVSGASFGFVDLNGLLTALSDPAAYEGTFAAAINNSGVIVGSYEDSAGYSHGFVATPIPTTTPEPDTLGSILLGCLCFLPVAMRQRHRRDA